MRPSLIGLNCRIWSSGHVCTLLYKWMSKRVLLHLQILVKLLSGSWKQLKTASYRKNNFSKRPTLHWTKQNRKNITKESPDCCPIRGIFVLCIAMWENIKEQPLVARITARHNPSPKWKGKEKKLFTQLVMHVGRNLLPKYQPETNRVYCLDTG